LRRPPDQPLQPTGPAFRLCAGRFFLRAAGCRIGRHAAE
jgi:hypothetical protein